jgi:SAM-dependent methyltransferase
MLGAGLSGRDLVLRARSFYGVYQVTRTSGADASHQLMHGSTLHGLQRRGPTERRRPLSYYARSGPVGDAFEALPARVTRGRVAVVGLGSGSLACYALPGSRWTLLEIDPLIARIARDTALFSFLGDCAPDARVVLGDARRALEGVPDRSFDLLLLDAFTSDAIPVHLLTLEALRMYASKLAPDGVMLIHVSNQYLDLKPVVGGAVHRQGWVGHWRASRPSAAELREGVAPATWIAVAPRLADLGGLPARAGWTRLDASRRLWTDDYSNLLGVLRR